MNLDNMGPNEIRLVRKGIVLCRELEAQLARGEACGHDCTELKEECAEMKEYLTRVNNTYGAMHPGKSI